MLIGVAFGLLALTLLVSGLTLRRERQTGLGLIPVAVFVFAFLYLVQPLYLIWTGRMDVFLTDWQVAKGVLLPAIMLACFTGGWRNDAVKMPRTVARSRGWNGRRLWSLGVATSVTGLALWAVFIGRAGGVRAAFGAPHGAAMPWAENTAYLYGSPWWVLSGLAMMITASCRTRLSAWQRTAMVGTAALLYGNAILLGSRTWVFATTATLFVGYALAKRRQVRLSTAFSVLGIAGVAILLVLGYRSVLHFGEKPQPPLMREAVMAATSIDDTHAAQRITGLEFVFHAAVLDTVDQTRKYHFAADWLYTYTVHLIPRIWWPEKPHGFNPPGITSEDIAAVTGLRIPGGAAPGIVANIYMQFGPLSPLFFLAFGVFAHRLYSRARGLVTPLATVAYVMLYALSLNAFGQGFGSILVPFPYSLAPVVAFHLLSANDRTPSAYRRRVAAAGLASAAAATVTSRRDLTR